MPSKLFKNLTELTDRALYPAIRKAQKDTLQELMDKLQDFIYADVYAEQGIDSYEPFYDRSEALYDIWTQTKPHVQKGTVASAIEIDDSNFYYNADSWEHYSKYWNEALDAEDYVNIIENGVSANHSIFGEMKARPFWQDFVKWCDKNYEKIFQRNLEKYL